MSVSEIISGIKYKIDCYQGGRSGKRIREVFWGSYEEALQQEMDYVRRHIDELRINLNPTLDDAIPLFLEWLDLHRSEKYGKSMRWAFKHLRPHFGKYPVSRITETLINQYKMQRRSTPVACNQELDYLKIIIAWMVKNRLASGPLPFRIEKLPYEQPLPRVPSHQAVEAFCDIYFDPLKMILLDLADASGRSVYEVARYRWTEFNATQQSLRDIPLTEQQIDALIKLMPNAFDRDNPLRREPGCIFLNRLTGKPYNALNRPAVEEEAMKYALIQIMYCSGPRFNDIAKARWEDVNWHERYVISRVKRGKEKITLLPDVAYDILEPRKKSTGFIFANPKTGQPYTTLKKKIKLAAEKSGAPIKGHHTFRHACGKNTLNATGNLRTVQEMLGHTQVKTTQKYTHVAVDNLREAQRQTLDYITQRGKKAAT